MAKTIDISKRLQVVEFLAAPGETLSVRKDSSLHEVYGRISGSLIKGSPDQIMYGGKVYSVAYLGDIVTPLDPLVEPCRDIAIKKEYDHGVASESVTYGEHKEYVRLCKQDMEREAIENAACFGPIMSLEV